MVCVHTVACAYVHVCSKCKKIVGLGYVTVYALWSQNTWALAGLLVRVITGKILLCAYGFLSRVLSLRWILPTIGFKAVGKILVSFSLALHKTRDSHPNYIPIRENYQV